MKRKINPPASSFTLNGQPLKLVSTTRDLGVLISANRSPRDHCVFVSKKASRLVYLVTKHLLSKNLEVYTKAFKALIRPGLEYASLVWSPWRIVEVNMIENVQRTFTRRILYKRGITGLTYSQRLQHLGLESLEMRRVKSDLIYLYKIINGYTGISDKLFFSRPSAVVRGHQCRIRSRLPVYDDHSKYGFSNHTASL